MSVTVNGTLGVRLVQDGTVVQADLGANVAGNGPAFSAYAGAATQAIVASTWTKVALNSEEFDTNALFDSTTNYRFTPNVAGYYQINGCVLAGTGANTALHSAIYKNGTVNKKSVFYLAAANGIDDIGLTVSCLIYLNGSTDYVELYALAVGTSLTINGGTAVDTWLNGYLARSA